MAKYVAQSERLYLQPLSIEEHLLGFHKLNSDPRCYKYFGHSGSKDLEASRAMMKTKMPSKEKPYLEHYAILIRPETQTAGDAELEMVGDVCIPRISDDGLASEIGYGIISEYWGKGYAPEAVKMLVKYFFEGSRTKHKEYLIACTDPENNASERVLEKSGFKRTNFVEKAYVKSETDGIKEWGSCWMWRLDPPEK